MTLFLFDTPKNLHSVIDASRCGLMCYHLGSVYYPAYSVTYLISFFTILASSITLFRNFRKRFETVKFWLILSIPIFLIVIRVNNDLLRDFVFLLNLPPEIRHILYAILLDMIGPSAGISAGLVFWFMTKNVSQSLVRNHILLISYGTVLFLSLNQSTGLALFQYPPLGVLSLSFMSIASYSMFVGVYFSAIYVAQNQKMRSFISNPKSPAAKQLRFITSIGTSENMQRLMSNISEVVSNMGTRMENESGVPSNWEENLNKYLTSVLSFKKSMKSNTDGDRINFYAITELPFGKPWEIWVQLWWKWRHLMKERINNEDQGPAILYEKTNDRSSQVSGTHIWSKCQQEGTS